MAKQIDDSGTSPRWRKNVEIVDDMIYAWSIGDLDTVREAHHPDVILKTDVRVSHAYPMYLGEALPGTYVGREAVLEWFEQARDGGGFSGPDRQGEAPQGSDMFLFAFDRVVGRGGEYTTIYTFREGKIAFVEIFRDRAEALDVTGFAEIEAAYDARAAEAARPTLPYRALKRLGFFRSHP
jgi:hypothetical protein